MGAPWKFGDSYWKPPFVGAFAVSFRDGRSDHLRFLGAHPPSGSGHLSCQKCEVLVTLMVTSPVLLASSWEQVKTIQWGFERFLFWGHWNGMEKDCNFLMIFFKSF